MDVDETECCPTRSLANYVAYWAGLDDCDELEQPHADAALVLLAKETNHAFLCVVCLGAPLAKSGVEIGR